MEENYKPTVQTLQNQTILQSKNGNITSPQGIHAA